MDKKLAYLIALVVVALVVPVVLNKSRGNPPYVIAPASDSAIRTEPTSAPSPKPSLPSSGVIEAAYRNQTSNLLVRERGIVDRILNDDNDGSRHQRFIVRLGSGHTILIAHNIDLAQRVGNLRVGDAIEFQGEYEWKSEGGVVHWTHHNPRGTYPTGFIMHGGYTYQ